MFALETLALTTLTFGVAAILRFVWLDSLRFSDSTGTPETADPSRVNGQTARRLALQAEAARMRNEVENLPRAA